MWALLYQARQAVTATSSSAVSAAEKCCVNSWHGSIASTESDCKESHAQAVVAAEWCVRDQQHAIGRRICADKGTVIYFMSWNG